MPFYEYECTKCRYQTEAFQKITDPPITKCGLCNGKMKKLISQSSFHLKGTGWYVTDYASKTGGYDGKTGSSNHDRDRGKESTKEAAGSSEKSRKESSSEGNKKAKEKG